MRTAPRAESPLRGGGAPLAATARSLQYAAPGADGGAVSSRSLRRGAGGCAVTVAAGLLAGCGGGSTAGADARSSAHVTKEQALAFARAVNLRAGDAPGFASSGSESECHGPPGPLQLEPARRRGVSLATRATSVRSLELSSGDAHHFRLLISSVDVWPTAAVSAFGYARAHSARGRACLARHVKAVAEKRHREEHSRAPLGPIIITDVPNPVPGTGNSFLTAIDETHLRRDRTIFFHVYRDIFEFISGSAEVTLEATAFFHPVPAPIEEKTLLLLVGRARANSL